MAKDETSFGEIQTLLHKRWPTPKHFYDERDDRTRRALGPDCSYTDREIQIFIDHEEANLLSVQIIALIACNLTARWARKISVCVPEGVPLCPETKRDNHQYLDQRLSYEMADADPFGSFECYSSLDGLRGSKRISPPLRLFVGKWNDSSQRRTLLPDDLVVSCFGWSILTKRGHGLSGIEFVSDSLPPVAGLAGSLAAADLFKRAIGHAPTDWIPTTAWDVKTHRLSTSYNIRSIEVTNRIDVGNMLLAGAGAIGSSLTYILDMMKPEGLLAVLDRDRVETSNLNRSPVFNIYDALLQNSKTDIVETYLERHANLRISKMNGPWHEYGPSLSKKTFDVWFSFTNEDGAWAEMPFQLPPVVFQATTTSGWGFGAGRHVPRIEDCTLCRLPRPETQFRGPCSEGDIAVDRETPIRAALPFLSTAAASLVLIEFVKFSLQRSTDSPNEISADLRFGLPAIAKLQRLAGKTCRGCQAMLSPIWLERGGRGRFRSVSA